MNIPCQQECMVIKEWEWCRIKIARTLKTWLLMFMYVYSKEMFKWGTETLWWDRDQYLNNTLGTWGEYYNRVYDGSIPSLAEQP